MPDFHDDFHGSALAHASLPVLQTLDRAIGGCCNGRKKGMGGRKREDDTKDKKWEDVMESKEKRKRGGGGRAGREKTVTRWLMSTSITHRTNQYLRQALISCSSD